MVSVVVGTVRDFCFYATYLRYDDRDPLGWVSEDLRNFGGG